MAPLKLYTYPGSKNAAKALIAAELNGVHLTVPPFEMGVSNKEPSFLALNPFGKVPCLEVSPGHGVFESNAIARYVARLAPSGLLGANPLEAVRLRVALCGPGRARGRDFRSAAHPRSVPFPPVAGAGGHVDRLQQQRG